MGTGAKPAGSDASLLPEKVGARLSQICLKACLTQSDVNQAVIGMFADMERRGELD
jgi:hypothetical protein